MRKRVNILLVTDDSSIVSMTRHCLKKAFPEDRLFTTRSGSEALEFINKSLNSRLELVPSLIVIDMDSAAANGLYLLQRFSTDLRIDGTNIAVLAQGIEKTDKDLFERLNLQFVLDKPFEREDYQQFFEAVFRESEQVTDLNAQAASVAPVFQSTVFDVPRSVLVVEPGLDERRRLKQALSRGSSKDIELDFASSSGAAKRKLRKQEYSMVLIGANEIADELEDLIVSCLEYENLEVVAIVDQDRIENGRHATVYGANLYIVRDDGNYLNVLNELVFNTVERKCMQSLSKKATESDKEMLREVIERAPLMMIRIDAAFRIKDCNDTFATASKRLRHTLVGRYIFDVLPDLEVMPMIAVLEDGTPYSREAFRMKTIGSTHSAKTYWDFHAWPIRRTLTSRQEVILIAADVSNRIEMEQQRERFVAALAHDIRNPLVGAQHMLDAITSGSQGEIQPPRVRQHLLSLQKSNQSLLLMLSNLIDVYKFEAGSQTLNFRSVDIRRLLLEQIDEVGHVAETTEIEFVNLIPNELPRVSGDISSLRRLLMNLLHNALKYAPRKSKIEVRAYAFGRKVTIKFSNQGSAIGSEKMRNLFRSVVEGVPVKYGSGLGLYLCRKIIQVHNGTIKCESEAKTGTAISVGLMIDETPDESGDVELVSL